MKKMLLLVLILIGACSEQKNKNNAISTTDSTTTSELVVGHDSIKPILDEADDITNSFYEGYLMEQLPKDSLEVKLVNFNEKTMLYGQKYKDRFLFEGDILINYPDTNERGVATGVTTMNRKWRKSGNSLVIYYNISPSLPDQQRVHDAIKMWTDNTGIQFVKRIKQADYILFLETPEGCFVEQVGRSGGEQPIRISSQCRVGNIAHEIGHILGLFHEQSRSDRDKYVDIDFNSAGGWASQYRFARDIDPAGNPVDVGNYDFYSIMHYPERTYFRVKAVHRGSLPPGIPGQRVQLSQGDVSAIKRMYSLR